MLSLGNITLRAPEPEDLDMLFSIENDKSLWHLSNTLTPYSRFDLEQFILASDKDIYATRQARFIIEVNENDRSFSTGAVDLFDFDPVNLRAGVGILILEKYRSKGYAGAALDIVIDYAFSHLGLHQLYCNIEELNTLSLGLFKKRGFVECGKKIAWNKRGKQWIDEYMLQLINHE